MAKREPDWLIVLGREWHACPEPEYASRLLLLLAQKRPQHSRDIPKENYKLLGKIAWVHLPGLMLLAALYESFGMWFAARLHVPAFFISLVACCLWFVSVWIILSGRRWPFLVWLRPHPPFSAVLRALRDAVDCRQAAQPAPDPLTLEIEGFLDRIAHAPPSEASTEELLASLGAASWLDRMLVQDHYTLYPKPQGAASWLDRMTAYQALIERGGEVIPHLRTLYRQSSAKGFLANRRRRQRLLWYARGIGLETLRSLAPRAASLLCPSCLTRFHRQRMAFDRFHSVPFYGCRRCGQSQAFYECRSVVAVLDASGEAQRYEDGILRVNWLRQPQLFDFDRVEIDTASEEAVERFAIQVGNDPDPLRQGRYRRMPCDLQPGCHLSENTRRILRSCFTVKNWQ